MSDDDLYLGPTVLAPGAKTPGAGDALARAILVPLLVLLALLLLVFYGLFQPAMVDGPSMLPTLHSADRLLVTHGYPTPRRGDIIVTIVPENGTGVDVVKRVIGLPGDTVEIRSDVAWVNGVAEPQRGQVVVAAYSMSAPPITVPKGRLYVMGDNRAVSEDSRYLGPVPLSGAKGRAVAIFAPVNRVRLVR